MNAVKNVVIIGAGVGGLTLAHALTRRGIGAEVYEANPNLRPPGGGLIVPPNSARILERLGLASHLRGGVPLHRMQILDAGGQQLYERDQGDVRREQGFGLWGLPRAALHGALLDALPEGTVHAGHRLHHLEALGLKTYAVFENRRHVIADLIVGADGATSRTRQLLFPEARLRATGQLAVRGVSEAPVPLRYGRAFTEFWGSGRRFTFFPIDATRTYWHAALRGDRVPARPSPAWLAEGYRAFPAPVQDLILETPEAGLFSTELRDLAPLARWSVGNVALLGDAAHATSPNLAQGAAQAIEDAAVLAELLAGETRLDRALERYQLRREAQTAALVADSRQLGQLGQLRGGARWLRNVGLKLNPELARRRIEAFYTEH